MRLASFEPPRGDAETPAAEPGRGAPVIGLRLAYWYCGLPPAARGEVRPAAFEKVTVRGDDAAAAAALDELDLAYPLGPEFDVGTHLDADDVVAQLLGGAQLAPCAARTFWRRPAAQFSARNSPTPPAPPPPPQVPRRRPGARRRRLGGGVRRRRR